MGKIIYIFFVLLLIGGCAVAPIRQEFNLPEQSVDSPLKDSSQAKLVIYNDSNKFMYWLDSSGKINITIDGKGAGRLSIGQFIVLALEKGNHNIRLHHKDIFHFKSSHWISIDSSVGYLKIYSKITSNGAEISSERPKRFNKRFSAAY